MKRLPPIEPVAGEVCQALDSKGVKSILVGGAVVTIYSSNEYQSMDLDFVVRGPDAAIVEAMASIGFKKGGGRHFERPGTPYIVEFLPPPPGIGRVIVQKFATRKTARGRLTLYDPTHCVMDRLAAFYHWSDPQGLVQAVMVARRHRIRMAEVKRWSDGEGMAERFLEFRAQLAAARLAGRKR